MIDIIDRLIADASDAASLRLKFANAETTIADLRAERDALAAEVKRVTKERDALATAIMDRIPPAPPSSEGGET